MCLIISIYPLYNFPLYYIFSLYSRTVNTVWKHECTAPSPASSSSSFSSRLHINQILADRGSTGTGFVMRFCRCRCCLNRLRKWARAAVLLFLLKTNVLDRGADLHRIQKCRRRILLKVGVFGEFLWRIFAGLLSLMSVALFSGLCSWVTWVYFDSVFA